MPNPWDAGSAKILAHHGFEALATTSAGFAFAAGCRDAEGLLPLDKVLECTRELVDASALPVSADLENGYANDPGAVADTIMLAAAAGVVGGSIEDATTDRDSPIRELEHAADCVRAAAEAKRSLPFPFILTARAENYGYGRPDLDDTIRRLQAYQEAGADVLYAPGISSREEIAAVVSSVERPVNVVIGLQGTTPGLSELSELGVKRASLGSALFRAAYGELINAIREIRDQGTFTFAEKAVSFGVLNRFF